MFLLSITFYMLLIILYNISCQCCYLKVNYKLPPINARTRKKNISLISNFEEKRKYIPECGFIVAIFRWEVHIRSFQEPSREFLGERFSATEFLRWRSTSNERKIFFFFLRNEEKSQVGAERPNELDSVGSDIGAVGNVD